MTREPGDLPLRNYVPGRGVPVVRLRYRGCCRQFQHATSRPLPPTCLGVQPMFPLSFLSRKVDFDSWRTLEAVLRWIVLGQAAAPQQRVLAVDAPELRFGVLGHGCLDPEHAQSFDPAHFRAPNLRPAEACVIGEGALAREAIRRLVALGAQTHTTAATVEEHAAALNEGASPRRAGGSARPHAAAGHRYFRGPIALRRCALDSAPSRGSFDRGLRWSSWQRRFRNRQGARPRSNLGAQVTISGIRGQHLE